jgi:hypothetical protein
MSAPTSPTAGESAFDPFGSETDPSKEHTFEEMMEIAMALDGNVETPEEKEKRDADEAARKEENMRKLQVTIGSRRYLHSRNSLLITLDPPFILFTLFTHFTLLTVLTYCSLLHSQLILHPLTQARRAAAPGAAGGGRPHPPTHPPPRPPAAPCSGEVWLCWWRTRSCRATRATLRSSNASSLWRQRQRSEAGSCAQGSRRDGQDV